MNDEIFKELCRNGLKKAIEDNDGYLANFYGRMLTPGFVISPRPKYIFIPWVE
jgi:hypothetical protein